MFGKSAVSGRSTVKRLFLLSRLFCCMVVLGVSAITYSTALGNALDDSLPPFVNAHTLTPETAQANDGFGRSLAISDEEASPDGTLLAVGAPLRDVAGQADQGAVFLYRLQAEGWTLEQVLTASDGAAGDYFGASLALAPTADTLLVGAPRVDSGPHSDVGTAYVFHYSGNSWQQVARLDPLAVPIKSYQLRGQGIALAENGQVAFVGALGTEAITGESNATLPGMVHVFTREGNTWTNSANIQGPTVATINATTTITIATAAMGNTLLAASDAFGGEIGLLAAGLYQEESSTIGRGIVHVYRQEGGSWARATSLVPSAGFEFDEFGEALAMTNHAEAPETLVLIGSPRNAGSAYLFAYNADEDSWREVHRFTPPDIYGHFGAAVALTQNGQVAAIGAPLNGSGAVHIYTHDAEQGWLLAQTVLAPGETGIRLGESIALSPLASHLFAGAPATTISSTAMQHALDAEGGALRVYVPGAQVFLPMTIR